MTYSEIRKNEEVLAFIKKGNANLGGAFGTGGRAGSGDSEKIWVSGKRY